MIYKVTRNEPIDGFDWLVWNVGIEDSDGSVLSNSLTWPGDSFDYADHGDAGTPLSTELTHAVRGFVEPGNSSDVMLQIFDWVAGSGSQLPAIAPAVQALIDDGPVLRLIVQDEVDGGGNGRFHIQNFGLFKLHGYGNSSAEGEWLLLEFMGFDTSCGQQTLDPIYLPLIINNGFSD
ncbi:MAG: hypothetical protein GY943_15700 [Chloroflexi bacterium]|nr:hypothetical protein [Chloroflexota bacterium]